MTSDKSKGMKSAYERALERLKEQGIERQRVEEKRDREIEKLRSGGQP